MVQLDYQDATPLEIDSVIHRMRSFHYAFGPMALLELHELVVKPRLAITPDVTVAEIGVGSGRHLGSYHDANYIGFDVDPITVANAQRYAIQMQIPEIKIAIKESGRIPLSESSAGRAFAVCTMHEVLDLESELAEMDRILEESGRVVIVERLCAISETPEHRERLRTLPETLPAWFGARGYETTTDQFTATYWGESLHQEPSFNYLLFCAHKP